MKRYPLLQVILLFVLVQAALLLYAGAEKELTFFGYTIKKSGFASWFEKEPVKPQINPKLLDSLRLDSLRKDSLAVALKKEVPDTAKQRFLLIGDSMLEGLMRRLDDYCAENGHKSNAVIWYGSCSLQWGQCDTLKHFIAQYKPTYIWISLGANELNVDHVERRDTCIAHILKQIPDSIPYAWVGPPSWRKDNGIVALIKKHVGEDRYFNSARLKYDRLKDGAHPTYASAAKWMDSVAVWIQDSSAYRVKLLFPDTHVKRHTPIKMLKPFYDTK